MWASWPDGCALYHRPSGQTHFVNEATTALLVEVLSTPKTLREASDELTAALGKEHEAQPLDLLAGSLGRLEALGLVRRVRA